MKVLTKYHGEIEVLKEKMIYFQTGIPGFPNETEFVILPLEDNDSFQILQSLKTPSLGFVVINPFHFFSEYDFILENQHVDILSIEHAEDVLVFSILTVQEPFDKTTANLQAPVIINTKNHHAKQVILDYGNYTTRHRIFEKR
ncbi:flagellar assembly protein FliW [Robertmurraya sp. GLU-23]